MPQISNALLACIEQLQKDSALLVEEEGKAVSAIESFCRRLEAVICELHNIGSQWPTFTDEAILAQSLLYRIQTAKCLVQMLSRSQPKINQRLLRQKAAVEDPTQPEWKIESREFVLAMADKLKEELLNSVDRMLGLK